MAGINKAQQNNLDRLHKKQHVVVIGGGFTGLAAAYELALHGIGVTVIEEDVEIGGLAGSFQVGDEKLEKFYHHWFVSDKHITQIIKEMKKESSIIRRSVSTAVYYEKQVYPLSSPLALLLFKPLSFKNRLRLAMQMIHVHTLNNWKNLDHQTAERWLIKTGGKEVYRVLWRPLIHGKFGSFASKISALWIWNKLKLRGGSRAWDGKEVLFYYRHGFAALAKRIADEIEARGGNILRREKAICLLTKDGKITGVKTTKGTIKADAIIATMALPKIGKLLKPFVLKEYLASLLRIKYLANICVVLELNRSLSNIYWLNVNDSDFPFVGVIEHTNFEPSKTYGGKHIVYLSKYLSEKDKLYKAKDSQVAEYCFPYLKQIYPAFRKDWIVDFHVWRARFAQPVVEHGYKELIPPTDTPLKGFYISTMAQIYPEDRGINYAIREGRRVARHIMNIGEKK